MWQQWHLNLRLQQGSPYSCQSAPCTFPAWRLFHLFHLYCSRNLSTRPIGWDGGTRPHLVSSIILYVQHPSCMYNIGTILAQIGLIRGGVLWVPHQRGTKQHRHTVAQHIWGLAISALNGESHCIPHSMISNVWNLMNLLLAIGAANPLLFGQAHVL